jgi:hypothetical protein
MDQKFITGANPLFTLLLLDRVLKLFLIETETSSLWNVDKYAAVDAAFYTKRIKESILISLDAYLIFLTRLKGRVLYAIGRKCTSDKIVLK